MTFTLLGHTLCAGDSMKLKLRLMAEGFVSPSALGSLDARTGSLLIADQAGLIRVMEKDGTLKDDPFLDLTSKLCKLNSGFDERGLLGMALHPKFSENRRIFVFISTPRKESTPKDWDHVSRLSEFTVDKDNPLRADLSTERVVLEIEKPYFNHNGGCIAFGPDGYLYISVGDGGNGNGQGIGHSPISNGQDLNTLLGKILRIDVDHGQPYSSPKDNPFVTGGGKPEIYAYGLRNPWRISFDRGGNHDLLVGDIGQTLWEEVDRVVKGGNYGWFLREGDACFNPADPTIAPKQCAEKGADGKPLIGPVVAYKNPNGFRNDPEAVGISIMGGYVYRGKAIPKLQGHYVFGDWSKSWAVPEGAFLVAHPNSSNHWPFENVKVEVEDGAKWKSYITSFGEDAEGELYVLSNASNGLVGKTGKVYKIVAVE